MSQLPPVPPPTPTARDPRFGAPAQRPGDDHEVALRPLDGILLVVWSILGQALVVIGIALAGVASPTGASLVAVQLLAQSIVLAGVFAWLAGRGRLSWRLLGSVPPAARHVAQGLAAGVAGLLLTSGVLLVAGLFVELEPVDQQLLTEALGGGVALGLAVVAAVVLAPLLEEVVFRGVLFQALGRRLGVLPAALLSGVLFAVVHLEVSAPAYQLALALLGTWFAYAFHRTRSLVVPIVAHATFNGLQIAAAVGLGG